MSLPISRLSKTGVLGEEATCSFAELRDSEGIDDRIHQRVGQQQHEGCVVDAVERVHWEPMMTADHGDHEYGEEGLAGQPRCQGNDGHQEQGGGELQVRFGRAKAQAPLGKPDLEPNGEVAETRHEQEEARQAEHGVEANLGAGDVQDHRSQVVEGEQRGQCPANHYEGVPIVRAATAKLHGVVCGEETFQCDHGQTDERGKLRQKLGHLWQVSSPPQRYVARRWPQVERKGQVEGPERAAHQADQQVRDGQVHEQIVPWVLKIAIAPEDDDSEHVRHDYCDRFQDETDAEHDALSAGKQSRYTRVARHFHFSLPDKTVKMKGNVNHLWRWLSW